MKVGLTSEELLALFEMVDEHVERCYSETDPKGVVFELKHKLDEVVARHHTEQSSKTGSARNHKPSKK